MTREECTDNTSVNTVTDLDNQFTGADDGYTALANTTISVVSNALKVEKNSGSHIFGTEKSFTITQSGTNYELDFDITLASGLGTNVLCKIGTTTVATITASGNFTDIDLSSLNLSPGNYTLTFITSSAVGGNGKFFTIDNVKLDYEVSTVTTTCNPMLSIGEYKYGFNGQERDNEVSGKGNSYTAEFWQYDSRLGRRWNIDPKPQIGISDYSTFGNNPILNVDPDGAYFFGLFGSTSEQRRTARVFAEATGGTINNITKRDVSVSYTIQTAEHLSSDFPGVPGEIPGVSIIAEQRRMNFLPTGGLDFGDWETNFMMRGLYEQSLKPGDYNIYTGYPQGSGAIEAPTIDPIDVFAGMMAGGLLASTSKSVSAKTGKQLSDLFAKGKPIASELMEFGKNQGWKITQSSKGPITLVDDSGIKRMVIKQGSSRTPGSNFPHVSLKNADGKFINPSGKVVPRNSPGNHTPINYDL